MARRARPPRSSVGDHWSYPLVAVAVVVGLLGCCLWKLGGTDLIIGIVRWLG